MQNKNLFKKIICGAAACALTASFTAVPVMADNGSWTEYVSASNKIVYTDIATYINHYPIPSYSYNGNMLVVAEDLRNYGFNVDWNNDTRTLNITPNYESGGIVGCGTVYSNRDKQGQTFAYAQSSDIRVYINGREIPSYNLDGYTLVPVEDLANVSEGTEYTWDPSTRSAKLWESWNYIAQWQPLPEAYKTENVDQIVAAVEWKTSYINLLEETRNELGSDEYAYYYLCDMNDDGMPEIIIKRGTCEADTTNYFYTFNEAAHTVVYLGSYFNNCNFYKTDNGILAVHCKMGFEEGRIYTFDGGSITETKSFVNDVRSGDYTEFPNKIQENELYDLRVFGSTEIVTLTTDPEDLVSASTPSETMYKASSAEPYQGIFKNGDTYFEIALYTSGEGSEIGVGNLVSKPEWKYYDGGFKLIAFDTITEGFLYNQGNNTYYVVVEGIKYGIVFNNGSITLYSLTEGNSSLSGDYVQISNSGANMDPNDVWLDLNR